MENNKFMPFQQKNFRSPKECKEDINISFNLMSKTKVDVYKK